MAGKGRKNQLNQRTFRCRGNSMTRTRSSLTMEKLEDRALMAADVAILGLAEGGANFADHGTPQSEVAMLVDTAEGEAIVATNAEQVELAPIASTQDVAAVDVAFAGSTDEVHTNAIEATQTPWTNSDDRFDVVADGRFGVRDVLRVLNVLRIRGMGAELPSEGPTSNEGYVDVNGNNRIDVVDAHSILSRYRETFQQPAEGAFSEESLPARGTVQLQADPVHTWATDADQALESHEDWLLPTRPKTSVDNLFD